MLAQQRQREILRRLETAGGARVVDLAKALDVAEETIRRDLEKLGRDGKLIRIHGGAVPLHDPSQDLPFNVRLTANHEAKAAIARQAIRHLAEGDAVALDASSTVHELARALPDMPLTVVTNSLPVTVELLQRPNVRVLSTGGVLDTPSSSWTGSLADELLDRVNINKFFLSSKGLDLERGLSEVDDGQARVKRRMMELAETVYLLVDHSKLGGRSVVSLARLDEVDVVICDAASDPAFLARLGELGVKVEVAE